MNITEPLVNPQIGRMTLTWLIRLRFPNRNKISKFLCYSVFKMREKEFN